MSDYSIKEQGIHNRDFVSHLLHSHITKLFKSDLCLFESYDGKTISHEDLESIRKKILDNGNDVLRDVSSLIEVFDFYLNPERLAAVRTKKITKKVVIGGVSSVR